MTYTEADVRDSLAQNLSPIFSRRRELFPGHKDVMYPFALFFEGGRIDPNEAPSTIRPTDDENEEDWGYEFGPEARLKRSAPPEETGSTC